MNDSWHANPAVWAYGVAALAFAWLVLRLVTQWRPGGKPAMLLAVALASAAAAVASLSFVIWPLLEIGWLAALADFMRVAASLGFLLVFLGVRTVDQPGGRAGKGWTPLLGVGAALLVAWLIIGVKPPGLTDPNPLTLLLGFLSALGVAVFGLMLVEQCYRRTPGGSRWHIRPLVLGMAGVFAFDVVLYSDALPPSVR